VNTIAMVTSNDQKVTSEIHPFTIDAPRGPLFAIEQIPDNPVELCVIMCNSGMVNRAGPQRLYWAFSNAACQAGIAVIRVDLSGVGDSLAETDATHFDTHRAEDVQVIIDHALSKWPGAQIVLQGLCAGSRVSFKTAKDNPKVAGILAWSTEIFTASQNMPQSPHEPEDRLSDYDVSDTTSRLRTFLTSTKFLKPSWWRKHYPGGKGLLDEIIYTAKCMIKAVLPKPKSNEGEFLVAADDYLKKQRKVFFAFGEYDHRAHVEFRSRFADVPQGELLPQGYSVIETGTHTFSTAQSQNLLFKQSINWLKHHFLKP